MRLVKNMIDAILRDPLAVRTHDMTQLIPCKKNQFPGSTFGNQEYEEKASKTNTAILHFLTVLF
jgi:hypothetical protein